MTNRRRPNDGSGLVKALLKRPALQPGVLMVHTDPLLCFTHRCSHYANTLGVTFYIQVGSRLWIRSQSGLSGCWILHTLLVWCFTTGVINLASESSQDRPNVLPVFPIQSHPVPAFPIPSESAPRGTNLEIQPEHGSNTKLPQSTFRETGRKALRRCPHHPTPCP
jgi:hypothetical protein